MRYGAGVVEAARSAGDESGGVLEGLCGYLSFYLERGEELMGV